MKEVIAMENTTAKTTLNEAILKVISTQFKKDAREAHKIVEEAGYTIYKNYGAFVVVNPETNKSVYIDYSRNGYSKATLRYGSGCKRFDAWQTNELVFDFVGCLNKPFNMEWRSIAAMQYNDRPTIAKYDRIKSAARMVRYYENDIVSIQKKMNDLQKELIRCVEQKVRYEEEVKKIKKELGL